LATDSPERLREALAEIHKRWGSDALRPLSALKVSSTHIPTGFPALDVLLGGGIPCGRAVELCGVPTSGMTTLALKIVAEAQAQGRATVYVDLSHVFDPDYAIRCGVELNRLLVARPNDVSAGLDILHVIASESGAGVAVFDSTAEALAMPRGAMRLNAALRKLAPALRQTGCTALLLNHTLSSGAAVSGIALRLRVENVGWIDHDGDVSGLRARVTVVKDRRNRAGQQVEIAMMLDDPAQEDAA
jgi:recombination protein RecA